MGGQIPRSTADLDAPLGPGPDAVLRGERPAEPVSPERYHQLERGQGVFSRSFRFAAPVLGDKISADLRDGVLTVTVPKVNDTRPIQMS